MSPAVQTSKDSSSIIHAERRMSKRHGTQSGDAYVLIAAAGEPSCPGRIKDVSTGGIALLTNQRFEPGTLMTVDVQHNGGLPSQTVLLRVTHVTERSDGSYVLGGAFTHKPSGTDLLALLA
jgi:hypothetical protein